MIKIKKRVLLQYAKAVFLFFLLLSIIIGGYTYTVINELKLKISEKNITKASIKQPGSILEADTTVRKQHLEEFLIFTSNYDLIKKEIESKTLEPSGRNYIVNKELEIAAVAENNCSRVWCIKIKRDHSEIPATIWKALLGTEDFRFLDHRGVDPMAIARAIVVDIIAMKFKQGGSTLTQQLMKGLFLTNEKSINRKVKEMIYSLYIENIIPKKQIITLYLNSVFWGSLQNIKIEGYHAASLAYFGKGPKYLTEFEATILISLLKGPNYYRPSRNIENLKNRTTAVFRRLQGLGLVTKSDSVLWTDEKWEDFKKEFIARSKKSHFKTYYLISKNAEAALNPYEKFVFYKAVNDRQKALSERTKGADIGVKAIVAEKSCSEFDCEGVFSFYSKVEREKRAAITSEYHQIGSLFKPIVYDTFVELGRDYEEEISTKKLTLKLKSGTWTPKDYSKAKVDKILLKTALQKSKNIPLVRVASEVGFDELEKLLAPKIPRLKVPLSEYPAQLLGAIELSLEEVFTVYNKFIQDKCSSIKENSLELEKTILYYMSVASETTISKLARGPLKNAYIFGKTGTSNKGLDNWYFAFDGKQIYVIWFGVESQRDKHNIKISGASTSFLIFQDFMNYRGKQISEIHCE